MIAVSAFKWVPDFARGLVRDHRVRWALEEAGLPYTTRLLSPGDGDKPEYRKLQPFGQVPIFEEDGLQLFESGAIVLHIAERSEVLLPKDPAQRARAIGWMFAALNSIEPGVQDRVGIDLFFANEPWADGRRPVSEGFVRRRLQGLSGWLGDSPYLEGRFTAGDLLMSSVLRILRSTTILEDYPNLKAYKERCESRPAFQRALKAQMDAFDPAAAPIPA